MEIVKISRNLSCELVALCSFEELEQLREDYRAQNRVSLPESNFYGVIESLQAESYSTKKVRCYIVYRATQS